MKKLLGIAGLIAIALIIGAIVGHDPWKSWPPIPKPSASGDIAAVAHPPAPVLATVRHDCYNCHSDHPDLPWYGYVWPASAQVQDDIHRASARLNFSEWNELSPEMRRIRSLQVCMMVSTNKMPIWYYRPLHPTEHVSQQQATAICNWANSLPQALTTQQPGY